MKPFFRLAAILVFVGGILAGCGETQAPSSSFSPTYITIGTGEITGIYYPTGGAIAKMVNEGRERHRIRCAVEATGGSVDNVRRVLAGDLAFGMVQSDVQHEAVTGQGVWQADGPRTELRACFSIHDEAVTLVAAADAAIGDITDLRAKRVNIGNRGAGARQNAVHALEAAGFDYTRDLVAEDATASQAPGLLQDGRIDAFFYTVGHPSGVIKEATAGRRRVRFASIRHIDALIEGHPYYARTTIPVKYYPRALNTSDVPTFGVKGTLVTAAAVSDTVVYTVVKAVFDDLETFKTLHPVYAFLTPEGMLDALSAPYHPGALKYLREAGLVK